MAYPKNDTIKVVITSNPTPGNPNGVAFALKESNAGGPVQAIHFKNDQHPGTMVYFKIDDQAKSGLLFQQDPKDALWVQVGNNNPPAGATWPGFVPLSVENDDTRLIVYNRNLVAGVQFKFTLRFRWPNGNAIDYDPIGNDNNGLRS